jgi:hypothetical protein
MSWRYVGASVTGTAHQKRGFPCQDTHAVGSSPARIDECFWVVVADGAGSAQCAERGAQLACDVLGRRISRWFSVHHGSDVSLDSDTVSQWIEGVHVRLTRLAEQESRLLRDYACTLSVVVVGLKTCTCFQIGDGAIVIRSGQNGYEVVFWPDSGENINMTHFVTDDDFVEALAIRIVPTVPEEVAVFTDGLNHLALHYASRTAHAPFFLPMFRRLAQEGPGRAVVLEPPLRGFLGGAAVNQRTEDDRTLVLATRIPILD